MSLKKYSREELQTTPMIELANMILSEKKKAVDFRKIYKEVADFKGFTEEQKEENLAQFYTDLTVDGRFMSIGSSVWGLKRWYPVEQTDEEVIAAPKKKKKAKKKKKEVKKEQPEVEEDLDVVDDNIEILTDKFVDPADDDEDEVDDFDDDDFIEDDDEDLDDDLDDDNDDTDDDEEDDK
ncbi:DNA-directed RNA polymerase subunit delta [Virgibacillus kekensis]|uniref:Probable DNA-directed RNA polymerase subunit delta n=1 Tax=Virgibacillus kekensis TaxID=202261 RepID=A0ABV9DI78_9BACI